MVSEESIKEIFKKLGYQTSIGNHGLIFVTPIDKGNSFTKSFPNYQEAYIYYIEPNKMSEIPKVKESSDRINLALTLLQSKMNECTSMHHNTSNLDQKARMLELSSECHEHVAICFNEMADYIVKNSALVCKELDRLKEEALNG